jgi:predicted choloylglycine hydrolase
MNSVSSIPPSFLEFQNDLPYEKKIDSTFSVAVRNIPAVKALNYISALQTSFNSIAVNLLDDAADMAEVARKTKSKIVAYYTCINIVFELTKDEYKKRKQKKYFRALKKKAEGDIGWFVDLCTEIFDYWSLTKKKIEYLASGTTLRQMYGADVSWDFFTLDGDGKMCVKPRFG